MVIEDLAGDVEKPEDGGVAYRVVHVQSRFARDDDVFVPKHGKLL
jgi:hypothetical protein